MENTAVATAAEEKKSGITFKGAYNFTKSALKGATGLLALGVGGAFVASGLPLAVAFGAFVLYSGARSVFDAGRELLPLKTQNFVSETFTGKTLTEIKPVQPPKTVLGKIIRVAEFAALTFAGGAAFASAGFAMGFGGSVTRSTAALYLGGVGLMFAGATNVVDQAVKGVIGAVKLLRKDTPATPAKAPVADAPEAAPSSTLSTRTADVGFNKASAPAVEAAPVVPAAKPVIVPPSI